MALLGEVDETARGADDDLDAPLERLDLGLVGPAAVDGEDADAALRAGALEVAGHLDGELAGRGDGEGLRLARGRQAGERVVTRGDDAVEDRDAEAEGLARAGLGLPMMSWPPRATGSVIAWMGKGLVMPCPASAATMSGWIGKSEKLGVGSVGAACGSAWASVTSVMDSLLRSAGARGAPAQRLRADRRSSGAVAASGDTGRPPIKVTTRVRADRAPWSPPLYR